MTAPRPSPMYYVNGEIGLSFFTTTPGQNDEILETFGDIILDVPIAESGSV
jgi:hypothetical protein